MTVQSLAPQAAEVMHTSVMLVEHLAQSHILAVPACNPCWLCDIQHDPLQPFGSLLMHTGFVQIPEPRQGPSPKRQVLQHQAPQKQKPQQQLYQRQLILLLSLRFILQIIRILQRLRNQLFQHLVRLLSR